MKHFDLCIDQKGYTLKPRDYEVGEISIRVGNNPRSVNANNIRGVVRDIASKGHSFSPATFYEGLRRIDHFKQLQLFALDFDGGISLHQVIDRSKKYSLPILFSYETLTSTDENKFRIIYLNDISISNAKLARIIQNAMLIIFPEADKACSDISRMYFGGKKLLYFDESLPTINPELVLRNMTYYLKNKRGPTHYKKYVKQFADKHKIRLNQKGLLDISMIQDPIESNGTSDSGKNSPTSIIFHTSNGEVLPNLYYKINLDDGCTRGSIGKKNPRNHSEYRSSALQTISNRCKLFKEFESGERKLHHAELFGVSTNINHIESGVHHFKEILLKYPEHYEDSNRWDFYLQYNKENEYIPMNCNLFCPYIATCNHGRNILSTVKPKMERLENYIDTFHSLDEVSEDVTHAISRAC